MRANRIDLGRSAQSSFASLKRSLADCGRLCVLDRYVTFNQFIMSAKKIVRIDGFRFNTLEEFFDHFAEKALDSLVWGKNLDAFNDVLRGGFGTPEDGFVIEWQSHERSKECLGFEETIQQLQLRLLRCHPLNVAHVTEQLMAARRRQGSTVFDWLVEIIQTHCPGGAEASDGIELVLR
jgi:hypothetical protein